MSFAATIPDGCGSFVVFFHNVHHLNCIIKFLLGTQPMHMTFTFVALFFMKSVILLQKYLFMLDYV